jgi:DNA (cytosine-5)-methyltransferase 1
MIKVLNLYAGIGGNRKLWPKDIEVTAVEYDEKIVSIYKSNFPNDQVIISDAHEYLLKNYSEFDFIWSSPPCPTHSGVNNFLHAQGCIRYPAMELWQEIIFLQHFAKKKNIKWVVENVKSYYPPLWEPQKAGRHYFWSNFKINSFNKKPDFNTTNMRNTTRKSAKENLKLLKEYYGFNVDNAKYLRNCVHPDLGEHIFNEFLKTNERLGK